MNFESCGDADDDHDYHRAAEAAAAAALATAAAAPAPAPGLTSRNSSTSDNQVRRETKKKKKKHQQQVEKSRLAANGNYADDETSIPTSNYAPAAAAAAAAALNLKLSSPLRRLLLCLQAVASLSILLADAKVTTTTTAHHLYENLIEGRLDTSQLCGTRYPASQPANNNNNNNNNNLLYIVGGDEVEDEQFWPWSVAIYELDPLNGHKEFICSGSLVSGRFILTAAHCIQQSRFDTLSANEVFVKIAAVRLDDERAHFYHIASVHIHPEYSVDRKANDIALLRLAPAQRLPHRARPICLPSTMANRIDFTDQQVTVIGWGKTSAMRGDEPTRLVDLNAEQQLDEQAEMARREDEARDIETTTRDTQTNDTLLQAEVRVTNTDQCNRNYSRLEISWLNIDEHFLCASDPLGKRDACQGDSGGPLMWNNQQQKQQQQQHHHHQAVVAEKWYQLGLVSFGHGCANSQFPGVYTRISYYMPWILKTIM